MKLSITKIKAFKACRKMYELKYIEGLEPVRRPEALETGSNYNALLEELNKTGSLPECDYSKEYAMAKAYEKYIYPKFKVVEAEKWVSYPLGEDDELIGIVDGIAEDGHIVEHKSAGSDITEAYEYNLLWDEQILAYMLMTGRRKVHYTVCRKPTIRLCKNETQEEFYERMVKWYDEDTESKIRLLEIERSDEEVKIFEYQLYQMLMEMHRAEKERPASNRADVQAFSPFYRNTCHCNMWGRRCEYSSVCLNYDPNAEYIEFVRKGEKGNGAETN